ncbi:CU044_5270 family protein [Streptomyces sp. NPDC000618]|uniref:CU044_5270 family protein n=1 Tax=Streptomyces sp. NPDC000618 TaxID=3154265 RepID=UPI003327E0C7
MNQVPEPSERDLPPGRHRLLKEHLMTEIRHTDEAVAKPRKRWMGPALAAAAVATVASVTFTVLPSFGGADAGPRNTPAAERQDGDGRIRNDQFVYVESEQSFYETGLDKKLVRVRLHRTEVWVSVDGTRKTMVRDDRDGSELLRSAGEPGQEIYGDSFSYNFLKSLPTDPDAMYDYLVESSVRIYNAAWVGPTLYGTYDEHQAVLQLAGKLLSGSIVPSAQRAALYQAVTRTPGVRVDEDSVDARGRHGVGIMRTDTKLPIRFVWTFDKKTHELLGQRATLTQNYKGLKKGTVLGDTAVLRRAVVDKAGERP